MTIESEMAEWSGATEVMRRPLAGMGKKLPPEAVRDGN
jgi:hypothetical protein